MFSALQPPTSGLPQLAEVLGDGAPWIWNIADRAFPGTHQMLDWRHLRRRFFGYRCFDRARDESLETLVTRPRRATGKPGAPASADRAVSRLLFRGDLDVVPGSHVYALFRERAVPTRTASDLLVRVRSTRRRGRPSLCPTAVATCAR